MTVTKTVFGRRQRFFQASRSNLYKLTYVKRLYRHDSEGVIVEVPPELKIWAKQLANYSDDAIYRDISYRIGQSVSADNKTRFYGRLTTPELDWLAEELSHWLGLPISRE